MRPLVFAAVAVLAVASAAQAQVRHIGAPEAAIARAVVVPPGARTIYVSGIVAQPLDPAKPADLGDTRTQTASILHQIGETLAGEGFGYGDVVMMRVYLAGDPAKGGKMDFAGMMEAYRAVFGTPQQPNKPARVTVQVAALGAPGALAEIEVQAAKAPAR